MDIPLELILALITAVSFSMSIIVYFQSRSKENTNEKVDILDRLDKLEEKHSEKIQSLEVKCAKMETLLETIEKEVGKLVKQPIHLEKDQLIDKMIANQATGDDLLQLHEILEHELKEHQDTKNPMAFPVSVLIGFVELRLNSPIFECVKQK